MRVSEIVLSYEKRMEVKRTKMCGSEKVTPSFWFGLQNLNKSSMNLAVTVTATVAVILSDNSTGQVALIKASAEALII